MRTEMSMLLMVLVSWPAAAGEGAMPFPAAVQFETGDTWVHEASKSRLFGVQACLRDTRYRLPGGDGDCGLRSIGALAALFSTNTVACQAVGIANDGATFVVCAAEVGGATVDVGTALISSGFAFAAVRPSGAAVLPAYAVAEAVAKRMAAVCGRDSLSIPVRSCFARTSQRSLRSSSRASRMAAISITVRVSQAPRWSSFRRFIGSPVCSARSPRDLFFCVT